jgi:hypothetical protein
LEEAAVLHSGAKGDKTAYLIQKRSLKPRTLAWPLAVLQGGSRAAEGNRDIFAQRERRSRC